MRGLAGRPSGTLARDFAVLDPVKCVNAQRKNRKRCRGRHFVRSVSHSLQNEVVERARAREDEFDTLDELRFRQYVRPEDVVAAVRHDPIHHEHVGIVHGTMTTIQDVPGRTGH